MKLSKEQVEASASNVYYCCKENLPLDSHTSDFAYLALNVLARLLDEPSADMQDLIHGMFGAKDGSDLCSVVKGRIVGQAIEEALNVEN